MRNITQYPITSQEVKDALHDEVVEKINSPVIGGTSAYAISMARSFIEAYEQLFNQYIQTFELGGNKVDKSVPYLTNIKTVTSRNYNPDYDSDKICQCGHPYYRHFDPYEDMYECGCKYCNCSEFKEKS